MSAGAVFDCMIFVQAAANPLGPAMACFERLSQRKSPLFVSDEILSEIGEVLVRPELRRRLPSLTPQRVAQFLDDVNLMAIRIDAVPRAFPLPRDPKDEPYLNLAIAADAAHLVTRNTRHLTYLMQQNTPEGQEFCGRYPGLTILDPVEFLQRF